MAVSDERESESFDIDISTECGIQPCMFEPEDGKQEFFASEFCFNEENKTIEEETSEGVTDRLGNQA